MSKKQKLRSRAWFKINEIEKKYHLMNKNSLILEIGCSPGGWTEYITKKNIKIISLDIKNMNSIKNNFYIKMNIEQKNIYKKFLNIFKKIKFNIILSDACPNISGNYLIDNNNIKKIINVNFNLINTLLKKNGNVVIKIFNHQQIEKKFFLIFHQNFFFKPYSSKKNSKEIFCILKKKL